jgi:hypothetical protein
MDNQEMKYVYVVVNFDYGEDGFEIYQDDYALENYDSCSQPVAVFSDVKTAYHRARFEAKREANFVGRPYKIIYTEPNNVTGAVPEAAIHFIDDDACSVWAVLKVDFNDLLSAEEAQFEDSFPDEKSVKDYAYCCNCRHWTTSINGKSGYCRVRDRMMNDGMVILSCHAFEKEG